MAAKPTEEVKKSDGFAFPGDPSVNLRMTDCLFAVMLSVSETSPGRVGFRGVYYSSSFAGKNFVKKIIKNFCKNLFKTLDNAYKRCYNVGSQTVRVLTLETGDC